MDSDTCPELKIFIPHSVNICKSCCGNINVFDYRASNRPLRVITWNMVNASYFSKIQKSQNPQIHQI